MEELEKIWGDNDMEGLPFSTSVNEAKVLKVLKDLSSKNSLNADIYKKVKQWIKFNRYFNETIYEKNMEYESFAHNIYLNINILFLKNGFGDIID